MLYPKSLRKRQIENQDGRNPKRKESTPVGLASCLSKLTSSTKLEPFPSNERLLVNLKDLLIKSAALLKEEGGIFSFYDLQKLIERTIQNLQKAIKAYSKPCLPNTTCKIRIPAGAPPPSTEYVMYGTQHSALNKLCDDCLDQLVDKLTKTLQKFANLPAERLTRNLCCLIRALKTCRKAWERVSGDCPKKINTEKLVSLPQPKYSKEEKEEILLDSGLFTKADIDLFFSNEAYLDLKKKVALVLASQRAKDKELLMISGSLEEYEKRILEYGEEWTDVMKHTLKQVKKQQKLEDMERLLNSKVLTESEQDMLMIGTCSTEIRKKLSEIKKDEAISENLKNKQQLVNGGSLTVVQERLLASGLLTKRETEMLLNSGDLTIAMKNKQNVIEYQLQLEKQEVEANVHNGAGDYTPMEEDKGHEEANKAKSSETERKRNKNGERQKPEIRKFDNCGKELSNYKYVSESCTVLPIEEIMSQNHIHDAHFVKQNIPRFGPSSFRRYTTGVPFTDVNKNERCEFVLYPSGDIAIEYYFNNETKLGKYTVYEPGPDGSTVLGVFDTLGYGVVFDQNTSCIRLKYTQQGGIFYEDKNKFPFIWNWPTNHKAAIFNVIHEINAPVKLKNELSSSENSSKLSLNVAKSVSSKNSNNIKVNKIKNNNLNIVPNIVLKKNKPDYQINDTDMPKSVDKPVETCSNKSIVIFLNHNIKLTIKNQRSIKLEMEAQGLSTDIDLGIIIKKTNLIQVNFLKEHGNTYSGCF